MFCFVSGSCAQDRHERIQQILEAQFPDCEVQRTTRTLGEADIERVEKLAGTRASRAIVYPYRATREGELIGTAYFDAHRVRSKRETLLVVVAPDGRVSRVEVVQFDEPEQYKPSPRWLQQFRSRPLNEELRLRREIRGISGSTLSARAVTFAVRRTLAIHQVLGEIDRRREEERRREEQEQERRREEERKKREEGGGGQRFARIDLPRSRTTTPPNRP